MPPFFMPVCLFFIVGGWVGGWWAARVPIYNPESRTRIPNPKRLFVVMLCDVITLG